jgi:DNA-binding LytR/AlgR family response regulator
MITAIAIDDEPPALQLIETFCSKIDFIHLEKTFSSPNEALKYLKKFPVDLLFLDINMPSMNGIELYKNIQQNTMVIFTTAYSEYAVESYNLNAVDYLLKPFEYSRFEQAVNRANDFYKFQNQTETKSQYIFIRADYSLNKIKIDDIHFIEGLDDYVKINTQSAKPIVARMTMKSMLEKLPPNEFLRVHRSFIIPVNKIESIKNKIIIVDGKEIPIGVSYEDDLNKIFKNQ